MNDTEYRSISILAIASLVLGVAGLFAFIVIPFVLFAVAMIPIAITAYWGMRKYNLSGHRILLYSFCLSATTLLLAPTWHIYQYRSESLPDYERVDFDAENIVESNRLDLYDSKNICLKGYALMLNGRTSIRTFQFSPNGNSYKSEDAITVVLPFDWKYQFDAIAISGTLMVNRKTSSRAERYIFVVTAIRKVNTPYDLVPRIPNGC